MADPNPIIKQLKVGGVTYDIVAEDLVWSAISATSGSDALTGVMTPDQIQALVNSKVASVYKVKGSAKASEIAALQDMVVGDVYNVSEAGKIGTIDVAVGDNVVYTAEGWDKLAADVDLSNYYTKDETDDAISSYVEDWAKLATSADVPTLWNEISGYVDEATEGASTSAELWNEAYDAVTGAVTTSADMTEANSGKLAQVGAITGYVDSKVAETIAETIDIAHTFEGAELSAIPDVGATSAFVDSKIAGLTGDYVEKKDITYNNGCLEFDI